MTHPHSRMLGSIALVATISACGGSQSDAIPYPPVYAAGTSGGSTAYAAPYVRSTRSPSSPTRVSTVRSTPITMTTRAPTPSAASAGASSVSYTRSEAAPPPPPASIPMGEGTARAPSGIATAAPAGTTTITVAVSTPIPQQAVDESQDIPAAGLLTAATVGDADRRENYLEYLSRHPDEQEALQLDLTRRLRVKVLDSHHRPVNDAAVTVNAPGIHAQGRTHADGVWDFYPSVAAPQLAGVAAVHVQSDNEGADATTSIPTSGDAQDLVFELQGSTATPPRVLDLGIAIDVTGSMGDELRYVNREVGDIVQRIEAQVPGVRVRVGASLYRDRVDAVPLQLIPFTDNVPGFASVLEGVEATGGGDYPEDMNLGLGAAMSRLSWSSGNAERVLVLIADAPPQPYGDESYTYRSAMMEAAARGIRIIPVAASGADRTVEYLFRAMGAVTSTPYVYLTDDSGVGAPHMEADTDRVAVERFNDVLTRMVLSDLRGEGMHEPSPLGPQG